MGGVSVGGAKSCIPGLLGLLLVNGEPIAVTNPPGSSDLEEALLALSALGVGSNPSIKQLMRETSDSSQFRSHQGSRPVTPLSRATLPLAGILAHMLGEASLPAPVGCPIGQRPIDLHCLVTQHFGIELVIRSDGLQSRLQAAPSRRDLHLPRRSAGASIQALLTCSVRGSPGMRISGIADLLETRFLLGNLETLGAFTVEAEGPSGLTVRFEGPPQAGLLSSVEVPKDAIELGSWVVSGLLLGEKLTVSYAESSELDSLLEWLEVRGAPIARTDLELKTQRWPSPNVGALSTEEGIHTDFIPILAALQNRSGKCSQIVDGTFAGRAESAESLARFLCLARVPVPDIRLGFAGLMLCLAVHSRVSVLDPNHYLGRGYPDIRRRLTQIGLTVSEGAI